MEICCQVQSLMLVKASLMRQMFDCTIKHLAHRTKGKPRRVHKLKAILPTLGSLSVWVGGCDMIIIFIGKQSTSVVNTVWRQIFEEHNFRIFHG